MRSIRLKFGFALPSASSCYLGKARKRSLLSVRYSVPPRRSAFANYVCIALTGSVGFSVLFVHKKNSSIRGSVPIARRRPKKRFNSFGASRIIDESRRRATTVLPRAPPKEGNRPNALARFDKISP
ncbi:hypothetical protein, partial [uncultured Rikenella sp.]|uniref:hypothetical protein n=1 Tax=uncultured Rikenella sp. TaxID=368003 RepID=UPI00262B92C4